MERGAETADEIIVEAFFYHYTYLYLISDPIRFLDDPGQFSGKSGTGDPALYGGKSDVSEFL